MSVVAVSLPLPKQARTPHLAQLDAERRQHNLARRLYKHKNTLLLQ